ncbi:MAG: DUF3784 domain-containing protein [Bacillus sp. (in: Bacteria)]|nr:DUF3784 domain-containing protein [Bacillus sp. (in: firmicutes)]
MEVYKIIILIIQIPTILILWGFSYAILKHQYYDLISGYSMKTEDEKQEMIRNGYPQAVGKVMGNSAYILIAGLILFLFNVPFSFEGSLAVMMIYMFAHLIAISKLDAKRVRRRNTIILVVTAIFTIGVIGVVFYIGEQPNDLKIVGNEVHVSGVYGLEWELDGVSNVELMEEMPRILSRSNGFSHGQRAKGRFRVEDLGNGTLFLYRNYPPFLFVQREDGDYFFINSKDQRKTEEWYEKLKVNLN